MSTGSLSSGKGSFGPLGVDLSLSICLLEGLSSNTMSNRDNNVGQGNSLSGKRLSSYTSSRSIDENLIRLINESYKYAYSVTINDVNNDGNFTLIRAIVNEDNTAYLNVTTKYCRRLDNLVRYI